MKIHTHLTDDKKSLILDISGDFNCTMSNNFKQAYLNDGHQPSERYVLNMENVHYIDSTALGMLLELRNYAKQHAAAVEILNMNDVVLELFRVMNFHKLFTPAFSENYYIRNRNWIDKFFDEHQLEIPSNLTQAYEAWRQANKNAGGANGANTDDATSDAC